MVSTEKTAMAETLDKSLMLPIFILMFEIRICWFSFSLHFVGNASFFVGSSAEDTTENKKCWTWNFKGRARKWTTQFSIVHSILTPAGMISSPAVFSSILLSISLQILDIYSANKNYAICSFFTCHILLLADHHVNILLYLQSSANLKLYYVTCYSLIAGIILFGGLLAPTVFIYHLLSSVCIVQSL